MVYVLLLFCKLERAYSNEKNHSTRRNVAQARRRLFFSWRISRTIILDEYFSIIYRC